MQRYFAKQKINNELVLYEQDHHHIKNVMRNKIGDYIEVVYENIVYICSIENIEPVTLKIIDTIKEDKKQNIKLTIGVSLVTEQNFDLILQKLTELGVSSIIPLKTERSIVKLDAKKIAKKINRWQTICKEASEQSKRTYIPIIENIISLKELSNRSDRLKLICSLASSSQPLNNYLTDDIKEILFVIGPEGGFTKEEEKYLLTNNFKAVSLGNRVMRVETAAIYVASIINYIYRG